jgi:hypothetical protein
VLNSWKLPFWSFTGRLAGQPRVVAEPEEIASRLRGMIADLDAGEAEYDARQAAQPKAMLPLGRERRD